MPVYTGPPKPPAEPLPVERSGPHKAYVYKQGKAPLIVFEPLEMERTTGSIAVPIVVSLGVNPQVLPYGEPDPAQFQKLWEFALSRLSAKLADYLMRELPAEIEWP